MVIDFVCCELVDPETVVITSGSSNAAWHIDSIRRGLTSARPQSPSAPSCEITPEPPAHRTASINSSWRRAAKAASGTASARLLISARHVSDPEHLALRATAPDDETQWVNEVIC